MPDLLVWPVNLKMAASYARQTINWYHFVTELKQTHVVLVIVNHCFTSLFGTKGLLSDIVIRCKRCSQQIMM